MSAATQVFIYGGAFQDTAGNPLAGGTVTFTLSQDSSTNGNGQLCAGSTISQVLDSVGSAGEVFALTSVELGNGVYHGTILGDVNAWVGVYFFVAEFTNPANNGLFLCTASTSTTLTLQNPSSVAETATAVAYDPLNLQLYPNSQLLPDDSYYTIRVYTAQGQLVFGPQCVTIPNTNPYNLNNLVPADWQL